MVIKSFFSEKKICIFFFKKNIFLAASDVRFSPKSTIFNILNSYQKKYRAPVDDGNAFLATWTCYLTLWMLSHFFSSTFESFEISLFFVFAHFSRFCWYFEISKYFTVELKKYRRASIVSNDKSRSQKMNCAHLQVPYIFFW